MDFITRYIQENRILYVETKVLIVEGQPVESYEILVEVLEDHMGYLGWAEKTIKSINDNLESTDSTETTLTRLTKYQVLLIIRGKFLKMINARITSLPGFSIKIAFKDYLTKRKL